MNTEDLKLIIRSFDAELRSKERERLERILTRTDGQMECARIGRMRQEIAERGPSVFSDAFTDSVLAGIRADLDKGTPSGYFVQRVKTMHPVWPVAAAILLLAAFAGMFWWSQRTLSVNVPFASVQTITLDDGTVVELNSGSALRYPRQMGGTARSVSLRGEAFFDVAEGRTPFIVETHNALIAVKGTRFSVRAWPDQQSDETIVSLESGAVDVANRDTPRHVLRLAPGESASVPAEGVPQEVVRLTVQQAMAWRTGGAAFIDEPLGDVLQALERRLATNITISSPELVSRRITYVIPELRSAEFVLADICRALRLNYRRTANGYELLE